MDTPLISLLHPTARVSPSEAFPNGWQDAFEAFRDRAADPSRIEYILAVHESRWEKFWEFAPWAVSLVQSADRILINRSGFQSIVVVKNKLRDCVVDQCNVAAAASSGMLLMGIMDDLVPPEFWDAGILSSYMASTLGPCQSEVIIVCSSGTTPERDRELMVVGAWTRSRYERLGYILHPAFESMFADNWNAHLAREDEKRGLCKIIERLDIRFEHHHPFFGHGQMDEVYLAQNRAQAYSDGAITFKKLLGARMIAIGLPGNNFSSQWVHGWTKLYGHLMTIQNFLTMPVFLYTSNVHCTRMEFAQLVLESKHKPEFVLSIDDDNILEPEQFDMLLSDLENDPTLAGVVGWCWCDPADPLGDKNMPYVASCGRQGGWDADHTENGEGLKCHMFTLEDFENSFRSGKLAPHLISSDDVAPDAFWSGLPVILMRRSALELLGSGAFLPMVRPDVKFGFTSEDTTFFYRAHQMGLKFAVDMRVKVPHLKLRAIEVQYLPGVERKQVLEAQGKTLGVVAVP